MCCGLTFHSTNYNIIISRAIRLHFSARQVSVSICSDDKWKPRRAVCIAGIQMWTNRSSLDVLLTVQSYIFYKKQINKFSFYTLSWHDGVRKRHGYKSAHMSRICSTLWLELQLKSVRHLMQPGTKHKYLSILERQAPGSNWEKELWALAGRRSVPSSGEAERHTHESLCILNIPPQTLMLNVL